MSKKVNPIKHIEAFSSFPFLTDNKEIFINEGEKTCHLYNSVGVHKLEAPTLKKLNLKAKKVLDDLANDLFSKGYGKKK